MFAALNEVDKIERRKAKEKKRMEEQQAKLTRDAEFGTESVKNMAWAEIDSDEEEHAPVPVSDTESDEESRAPSSPARSPARSPLHPPMTNGSLVKKAEKEVRPLSKKEKAAQKQKELDNLDDVLAEFGLDVPAPPTNDKKKKKKGRDKGGEETRDLTPEPPAPAAPAAPSQEEEQELDEDTKQAALDALRKKAAGKKGNKGNKSAAATAAAEAKKRAANKPKRDKMQYDR